MNRNTGIEWAALALDVFEDWQDRALCREVDAELFFPEPGGDARPAKRVCAQCEVRVEFLADALSSGEKFGIRGGLSERERRRLTHPGKAAA